MPTEIAPTITPTPGAVAPTAVPAASALPESMGPVVNNDYKTDIDKFFDGPEGAPAPAPAAPAPTPVPVVKTEPAPNSVLGRIAAKVKPAAPVVSDPAAVPTDDPVAKIEAEMRTHNAKWKPAEGWEKLKSAVQTERETRTRLEKELETEKARAQAPIVAGMTADQIEALKAREKAASDRLMVMDLENHPTFRAQYVEPKEAEIAKANELLTAAGVKGDIRSLLSKPRAELGKAVAELVKDMPDFDRVEVAEAVRKAYTLEQGGKAALGQSQQLSKALQSKTVERQKLAFDSRWLPVSAAIGEFVQPVETPADATPEQRAADQSYNESIKALRTKAEGIALSPMNEEGIAEAAIKAAAYDVHVGTVLPRITSEFETVVNLNRQLVAELNALRGRNPNHGLRGSLPPSESNPTNDPKQMDHAAAADYYFKK